MSGKEIARQPSRKIAILRQFSARIGKPTRGEGGKVPAVTTPIFFSMFTLSRLIFRRSLVSLTTAALFLAGVAAHAHSVWIEDTPDGKLVVRFGEPGEEVEKSPGRLDNLTAMTGWTHVEQKVQAFAVSKQSDHFLLEQAKPAQAAQIETGSPVRKPADKPARRGLFYARWQPAGGAAGAPSLNLDLVPEAGLGKVRVYFRGKALPGAKLVLHEPKGGERESATMRH
jgi:hypothetical protein